MTRHIYHCPVRWSDMDAYGHVNNAVFLTFLEEARSDMLGTHARTYGASTFEQGCVGARHEVEYKRPLKWNAESAVRVEMWVTRMRAASFDLAYEISDKNALYAKAASTMVLYDLEAERPRRLSEVERAYLALFLMPAN